MIDAWIPPRDGGLRYYVTTVGAKGGPQGWLGPSHLLAIIPPPTPKPVVVVVEKPAPVARVRKRSIGAASKKEAAGAPSKQGA